MAYTEVTISDYNATPPPDDGSTGSDNQVTWAGIKTKLGDPLKTAIEAIDDNVASWGATVDTAISTLEGYDVTGTLYAPSTTSMTFRQTTPPTGWTKQTTYNDTALRLVSGSVSQYTAGWAASVQWEENSWSTTSSSPSVPSHRHYFSVSGSTSSTGNHKHTIGNAGGSTNRGQESTSAANLATATSSSAGSHNHSFTDSGYTNYTGSNSSHAHSVDKRIDYVDIIIATKD